MNGRTLIVVAVIAIVAAVMAAIGQRGEGQRGGAGSEIGEPFLPRLAASLDAVNEVGIVAPGGDTAVTLRRTPERWVVAEADDYPADIGKIRAALTDLAEAEIVERKTSDEAFYSRLSVEPIDDPAATGVEVRPRADGADLPAVVLGDTQGSSYRFARKADEATSYLIDRDPELPRDPTQWVVPDIVDVPSARVERVDISHADGEELVIRKATRDATNYTVEAVPEGRELQYASVANVTGNALRELKLTGVRDADAAERGVISEFWTYEGLVVTVTGIVDDDERWITVAARFDADQAARFATEAVDEGVGQAETDVASADPVTEAREINARVSGWRYRIAEHQYDQMTRRMSDLLQPADQPDDE
jgi:hypothetical protein